MSIKFKRLIALLLICVLTLAGCGNLQSDDSSQTSNQANSEAYSTASEADDISENDNYTDTLEVHFIDVGQGDCTFIKCGEHSMLIDAGNNNKGSMVWMYLQKQGIEKLDYVIGTHPDADHIGGLDVVIYKFACDTIILPDYEKDTKTYEELIQTIENKSYKITRPKTGAEYSLGEAEFTIVSPVGDDYGSNANDYSVGIRLTYGDTAFLFTGDAEEEAENDMITGGQELDADVYKISHHGSKTANTEEFMNKVSPQYAVISCGEGNGYGHPHAEVLNRLRGMGVCVFRTDEQGAIVVKSDGKSLTFNCEPSTSWQAGEN